LKTNKNLTKNDKYTKIKIERIEFKIPITMRTILYLSWYEREMKRKKKRKDHE
jgi:hypothetical protein